MELETGIVVTSFLTPWLRARRRIGWRSNDMAARLRRPPPNLHSSSTPPGSVSPSVVGMTSRLASPAPRYAFALAVSVGTVLFLLLGIGALGIVGDGDRDWLYLAAPAVLLVVAAATRFRPGGMVLALGAAAATTVVAGVVAV